ncbi:hypothetical protein O181_092643 [Austropuccinia psidii MF-1]|uniref:Uncharacterized protein n=1 Tax=Austropuccinia psidii MF-1 TaxID=1389203 RepID=A0A9Q3IZP4_9BASI|nr:hypothetical protein [Austropuccinia psidii MF-1]
MEVYELLKEINQNNYGTNEVDFVSGDFTAPANNNNGESIEEDIEVPTEPSGNQGCHSGSENGESRTREEMGNWADGPENIPSQPEGSCTTQNICGNSSSQMPSISRGTTCRDRNFMNNMNTNMQNILLPLMLMLQQSQDREEERD